MKYKKLSIQLGLSISQHKNMSDCPDDETIAAYFDGKLSTQEVKKFLYRLNYCPDSYSKWLSLVETLSDEQIDEEVTSSFGFKKMFLFTSQRIRTFFNKQAYVLSGALSISFLFLLVVNVTQIPFEQLSLEKQISDISNENASLGLSFIDSSYLSSSAYTKSIINTIPYPEKTAYLVGLKQGIMKMDELSNNKSSLNLSKFIHSLPKQSLACLNDLCKDETSTNIQVGQWSSFVLQQCKQNKHIEADYWKKQEIIVHKILSRYQLLNQKYKVKIQNTNSLIPKINSINLELNNLLSSNSRQANTFQTSACASVEQLLLFSLQSI